MGGTRFLTRLSPDARIARAVCFSVTVHRCKREHYRKVAVTLDGARELARQMDAARAEGEPTAKIRSLSPEGKWTTVPDT